MADETRPTNFLNDGARSAQEAYYEYKLRTEKLKDIVSTKEDGTAGKPDWIMAEEVNALKTVGEKEKLEIRILSRLSGLADSSAELLQVKAMTDCKTREECARSLADIYYKKYVTEDILNRLVAPSLSKKSILGASSTASASQWDFWGKNQ